MTFLPTKKNKIKPTKEQRKSFEKLMKKGPSKTSQRTKQPRNTVQISKNQLQSLQKTINRMMEGTTNTRRKK